MEACKIEEEEYLSILTEYQEVTGRFLDAKDLEAKRELRKKMLELSHKANIYETQVYVDEFLEKMKGQGAISLVDQEIKVHKNGAKVLIPTTLIKNNLLKENKKYTMLFIPTL